MLCDVRSRLCGARTIVMFIFLQLKCVLLLEYVLCDLGLGTSTLRRAHKCHLEYLDNMGLSPCFISLSRGSLQHTAHCNTPQHIATLCNTCACTMAHNCTHTHMHTCTHTHTRTHTYAHTHTHAHTHSHMHAYTHTHAHTLTHTHTHTHTNTHTHTHTHTHTYTHTYTHTHTHDSA